MWLHIVQNEKFFSGSVELFETALPGRHVYGVLPNPKYKVPANSIVVENKPKFIEVLKRRSDWKGVIFNPLMPNCWDWLPHIPKNMKVIWYRWGAEAYSHWLPLSEFYRFMPKTKKWVYRNSSLSDRIREWKGHTKRILFLRPYLRRVDFFVGPEREEYLLFRKVGLLSSKTRYRFGAVELAGSDTFELHRTAQNCRDILLGNSAHPTNNHLEAIDWLASCELDDRKVIAPLSYGDDEYRDMICSYGRQKLGALFEPILEFLPIDDYKAMIDGCGYVVMNHLRQQATGNIFIMLLKGAKVFLNNTTVYRTYKNWHMHLRLIQKRNFKGEFSPLSHRQIDENRRILLQKLGNPRRIDETRRLLLG